MFCSNCGQRLADNVKHCPNCGMPVEPETGKNAEFQSAGAAAPEYSQTFGPASSEAPKPRTPAQNYSQTYTGDASAAAAALPEDKQALAGFILGLVSVLCCCTSCVGLVCGILAIVFGKKGLSSKTRHWMGVVAIVLGIIAVVAFLLGVFVKMGIIQQSGGIDGFMESFAWENFEDYIQN